MFPLLVCIFCFFLQLTGARANDDEGAEVERNFFVGESGNRMLETLALNRSSGYRITDCFAYGDRLVVEEVLKHVSQRKVVLLDDDTLFKMIDFCTLAKWNGVLPNGSSSTNEEKFGILSGIFIYPGTKWCGAGDIASSYDDLGPEVVTDRCCRDHDHCQDSIPGRASKYGLKNSSPVTKSHCDCDLKFHNCLREGDTKVSHRVGRIFFNFLCMDCFKQEHPIIKCTKHIGYWPFRRCQSYKLDEKKKPIWQFFDAKYYPPKQNKYQEIEEEFLRRNYKEWQQYIKKFNFHNTE